jgi:CRP-like cAMP-binding protein
MRLPCWGTGAAKGFARFLYLRPVQNTALIKFIQQRSDAPHAAIAEIASHFQEKAIAKGGFLLQAGRISTEYYFMETGFMRAFTNDFNGNEVTTGFFAADNMVFEPASFFTRSPSMENIQALADCNGCCISFEALNHLFHAMPAFREFGRGILISGFAGLKQRSLSLITETAETRYNRLVHSNSAVFQHAHLKHIASYLGITNTSLSRIRREYAKK